MSEKLSSIWPENMQSEDINCVNPNIDEAILAPRNKSIYIGRDFPEFVVFPTARPTGADEQEDYI